MNKTIEVRIAELEREARGKDSGLALVRKTDTGYDVELSSGKRHFGSFVEVSALMEKMPDTVFIVLDRNATNAE